MYCAPGRSLSDMLNSRCYLSVKWPSFLVACIGDEKKTFDSDGEITAYYRANRAMKSRLVRYNKVYFCKSSMVEHAYRVRKAEECVRGISNDVIEYLHSKRVKHCNISCCKVFYNSKRHSMLRSLLKVYKDEEDDDALYEEEEEDGEGEKEEELYEEGLGFDMEQYVINSIG